MDKWESTVTIYGAVQKNIGKNILAWSLKKDSKYQKGKEVCGGTLNYGKIIL